MIKTKIKTKVKASLSHPLTIGAIVHVLAVATLVSSPQQLLVLVASFVVLEAAILAIFFWSSMKKGPSHSSLRLLSHMAVAATFKQKGNNSATNNQRRPDDAHAAIEMIPPSVPTERGCDLSGGVENPRPPVILAPPSRPSPADDAELAELIAEAEGSEVPGPARALPDRRRMR